MVRIHLPPSVPESLRLRSPAAGAGRTVPRLPVRLPARRCRVLPAIGAAFPEAANNRVKVLRQMFTWACSPEYGYAEKNPARDVASPFAV